MYIVQHFETYWDCTEIVRQWDWKPRHTNRYHAHRMPIVRYVHATLQLSMWHAYYTPPSAYSHCIGHDSSGARWEEILLWSSQRDCATSALRYFLCSSAASRCLQSLLHQISSYFLWVWHFPAHAMMAGMLVIYMYTCMHTYIYIYKLYIYTYTCYMWYAFY